MKPVLLGMNNPHRAGDPLSPDETTGLRLRELSGLTRDDYIAAFDRMNLIESRKWSAIAARYDAARIRRDLVGRRVIVLGIDVWQAIGLPSAPWFVTCDRYGASWSLIPHPSGRNPIYNNKEFCTETRRFLQGFVVEYVQETIDPNG